MCVLYARPMMSRGRRRGPGMGAARSTRALTVAATCGCAVVLLTAAQASATDLPARTFDVASLGVGPGALSSSSADPVISADGTTVAFDSPATHTGAYPYLAAVREVYTINLLTGLRTLISGAGQGAPAGGTSSDPSISADGSSVAFVSTDPDLAPGASAQYANVYVRLATGRTVLASGGIEGALANGPASQPALSGNGQYVAFTSAASNLFPKDNNHRTDVFVRDLATGQTVLVSANKHGSGNGASSNPSISSSGRFVTFDSSAHNLRGSPHTKVANVYFRNLATGVTTLVSQTSGGVPQNKAAAPFNQVSSISASGKLVAFDSDATNLVRGDTNRRSDVFVRNIARHTTVLISVNNAGFEGNSDSFSPTISADGTKVAFESFATNLAPGGDGWRTSSSAILRCTRPP